MFLPPDSDDIDAQLKRDRITARNGITVLLLGVSEASTVRELLHSRRDARV